MPQATPDQLREIDLILDEGATPSDLHRQISQVLGEVLKADALIQIDRTDDGPAYTASLQGAAGDVPDALSAALCKIAPALLACDLGEIHAGYGLSGRMIFDQTGDVFLDAEDFEEDWDHQHYIATCELASMEFETPSSDDGAVVTDPA